MTWLSTLLGRAPSPKTVSGSAAKIHAAFWGGMPALWALPAIYFDTVVEGGGLSIAAFALLNMIIIWVSCYASTRLVSHLTRPWRLQPLLIFMLGGVIGILFLARPVIRAAIGFRALLFPEVADATEQTLEVLPKYFEFSFSFFALLIELYWYRIFCWTASVWFFFSFFGKPYFGIESPSQVFWGSNATSKSSRDSSKEDPQTPYFISKVDPSIGCDLIALKAERHYLRVYTKLGEDLIHYRFGDAVTQLSKWPGTQVHKSYWVNSDEARVEKNSSGKLEIILSNGLKVPIGQTYQQSVKAAGMTAKSNQSAD